MSDKREFLSPAQAAAMLPAGDTIHVFSQAVNGVLVGEDWSRAEVLAAFDECTPELSGPMATAANHGIALWNNKLGLAWFVQTASVAGD